MDNTKSIEHIRGQAFKKHIWLLVYCLCGFYVGLCFGVHFLCVSFLVLQSF